MVNKYLALQKDVFDIEKVTVVGSPTITSDGIASGFSTSNYLISSNSVTINPNNFRINFGFTTGSNITTAQMIIRSNDGQNAFIIGLRNGKIKLYLQSATTSGSWDIASDILSSNLLTTNTKYNGYLSFNGSVYTLNVNGSDWITVKSSALIRSSFALKIGQGMSAEPFLGSVNMLGIKTYSYNQLICTLTKPTYLIERRKPKVWNRGQFTIVGNPSISDDGIASGFSTSNYITLHSKLPTSNTFKVTGRFKCTNVGAIQWIFAEGIKSGVWKVFGIAVGIASNGDFICLLGNGSDSQTIRQQIKSNTWYRFEFIDNGSEYISRLSEDGVNYTEQKITKTVTRGEVRRPTIGVYETQDSVIFDPFNGSIDLKAFKIYTDNNLVFDGGADTYVYDPSKFTIVGSPTITEYGVASGFSTSNYINLPIFNLSDGDFEIETLVDYTPTGVGQCFYRCATDTYLGAFGFLIGTYASNKLYISGTTTDVTYDTALTAGKYLIKLVVKDGTANIYLNGNLVITGAYTKSISTAYITMGQGKNAVPFTGSMDLIAQSVKIKGKEVFNGVKENYYMLRR